MNLDYARVKRKVIPFKTVCEKSFKRDSILISAHNLVKVDCMGELVSAQKFCQSEFKDTPHLVRGLVNKELGAVMCIFSSQGILSWECRTKSKIDCNLEPRVACEHLKKVYAYSLPVFRAFYTETGADKQLNCYYQFESGEEP